MVLAWGRPWNKAHCVLYASLCACTRLDAARWASSIIAQGYRARQDLRPPWPRSPAGTCSGALSMPGAGGRSTGFPERASPGDAQ
jgi:hypothetical protein